MCGKGEILETKSIHSWNSLFHPDNKLVPSLILSHLMAVCTFSTHIGPVRMKKRNFLMPYVYAPYVFTVIKSNCYYFVNYREVIWTGCLEDSCINVREFAWRSSPKQNKFKIFFFCDSTKSTLEKYPMPWRHFNPIICLNLPNIFSAIIAVVLGISILQCQFSLVYWFCDCHLRTSALSFYFINWLFSNCYFMPLFDSSAFNVPLNWLLYLNDVRKNVTKLII